jgi:RNA polymerase-binding transcription factor DksA
MAANSKSVTKNANKGTAVKSNDKKTATQTAKKTVAKSVKKDAATEKKAIKASTGTAAVNKKNADSPKKVSAVKVQAKKQGETENKKSAIKASNKDKVALKKAVTKSTAVKKEAVKKVALKKETSAKKVASKKVAVKKEAAPKKKVAAKKVGLKKEVAAKKSAKKEVIELKDQTQTKEATPKKQTPVKEVAPKRTRAKKEEEVAPAPLSAREEIADAFVQKTKKSNFKKEEVVAFRSLNDSRKKAEVDNMEEFKPKRKSILDEPEASTVTKKRYSDEELNEFKELILARMEKAKKELVYLQGLITRKDDAGTSDTDNKFNHMEDGSGAMEREQIAQLAGRQIQFINHLEKAMLRIENKTYGVCRVTGELIDKARLRAVPHATLSIEAKNAQRK